MTGVRCSSRQQIKNKIKIKSKKRTACPFSTHPQPGEWRGHPPRPPLPPPPPLHSPHPLTPPSTSTSGPPRSPPPQYPAVSPTNEALFPAAHTASTGFDGGVFVSCRKSVVHSLFLQIFTIGAS